MDYRNGYKYQLAKNERFRTSFRPKWALKIERVSLDINGLMIVESGYAWDGASGIIDRKTNLRASCGHDALYQLMRMDMLSSRDYKKADDDYCKWLKSAGAWPITVKIDKAGLSLMKGKYAKPKHRKKIFSV